MTNTESRFTWAPLTSLAAGAVLTEWAEHGPLTEAPSLTDSVHGVPFSVVRFSSGYERRFPTMAEVRVG